MRVYCPSKEISTWERGSLQPFPPPPLALSSRKPSSSSFPPPPPPFPRCPPLFPLLTLLKVALLAFGVAALLYLITEELLVEAHEAGGPHVWYVDLMFFVGFIASVLLEQNIEDSSKGG